MTITELVKEAYETAMSKGWHDAPKQVQRASEDHPGTHEDCDICWMVSQLMERSDLEYHALIHSEVSEATEEARKSIGEEVIYTIDGKPEGVLIELADVVIRIADYCGSRGWDLEEAIRIKMNFNKTRSHRHGGKKF